MIGVGDNDMMDKVPISFLIIILLMLMVAESVFGRESTWIQKARAGQFNDEKYTVDEIDKGIEFLARDTRVKAEKDPEYRRRLAESFHENGVRFELPSDLLAALGRKESHFRVEAVGDRGKSKGIMQVGRLARSVCRTKCGKFSLDPEVQICHGACWLDIGRNDCGDLHGALVSYASGKCGSKKPKVKRAVKKTYKMWQKIHTKIRSTQSPS